MQEGLVRSVDSYVGVTPACHYKTHKTWNALQPMCPCGLKLCISLSCLCGLYMQLTVSLPATRSMFIVHIPDPHVQCTQLADWHLHLTPCPTIQPFPDPHCHHHQLTVGGPFPVGISARNWTPLHKIETYAINHFNGLPPNLCKMIMYVY